MKKLENNYFNSCDNLTIDRFYEMLNSSNYNLLRFDCNEFNVDTFPKDDSNYKKLTDTWEKIHDSYIEMVGNGEGSKDYTVLAQISELELEIKIVATLCQTYLKHRLKHLKIEIESWGYDHNDLDSIEKKIKGLQFRISIMKSKYPDIFNVNNNEDTKVIEYKLYKDVVLLEGALDDGRYIDVKITVVSRWVNYIKLADDKNKKIKNIKNG